MSEKPYVVEVREMYKRKVIVWGEDEVAAEAAVALEDAGVIKFCCEDYDSCSPNVLREATADDLASFDQYGKEAEQE